MFKFETIFDKHENFVNYYKAILYLLRINLLLHAVF